MERNYNVSGADRKELVKVIGEALGVKPKYMGTPSYAFQIGGYEVSQHGVLTFEEDKQTASVLAAIEAAGFTAEQDASEATTEPQGDETSEDILDIPQEADTAENEPQEAGDTVAESSDEEQSTTEAAPNEPQEDTINLSIGMPRETFTDTALANLDALLESKGNLIKAAFGIEDVGYTLTEERITFAWFSGEITAETSRAYADFVSKICEMARRQKRVTAKAKEVENPRYAFRCFLLRLGMIGDEYKASRRVLLERLTGNSAWKSGHGKGGTADD
ncbi:MAG: virulence protein [Selenomonas ruminantium]|uniref:Virulence protein n=1 Tax=Selenomonas ruminantium TaxID=971 RepID=A0A927WN34_SELRU|nr:virulence protein [Selenomonas ruminantium]